MVCGKFVKLCDGHFSENERGVSPQWQSGVAPEVVFPYGVVFALRSLL